MTAKHPASRAGAASSSSTEHTPGPWHFEQSKLGGHNIRDRSNNVPAIARTYEQGQAEANACLIATAPELLACCKSVLTRLEAEAKDIGGENPVFVCGAMRDNLRAAIAKATGPVNDSLVPDKATSDDLMPDESGQDEPDGAGAEPDLMAADWREGLERGHPEAGR